MLVSYDSFWYWFETDLVLQLFPYQTLEVLLLRK